MLLIIVFLVGYVAIVFEHPLKLNKAASALLLGVTCWTVLAFGHTPSLDHELSRNVAGIAQILFFLLSAMTLVELVDAHDGFSLITRVVRTRSRRKLLVLIAAVSFVLSAVLDNLTTSIVMMSLLRKLTSSREDRMKFGGIVILAANAGGAFSPIGDVTTTMLWVGGQISATRIIGAVFLPALVSILVPLAWVVARSKGEVTRAGGRVSSSREVLKSEDEIVLPGLAAAASFAVPADAAGVGKSLAELDVRAKTGASVLSIARGGEHRASPSPREPIEEGDVLSLAGSPDAVERAFRLVVDGEGPRVSTAFEQRLVFAAGVGTLMLVPVFKAVTHLPPMMGILLGLGVVWALTEVLHKRKNDAERGSLTVGGALQRVDAQSILFFLGILLSIGALEVAGILRLLASVLGRLGSVDAITIAIGLSSSVIDNVPLVAAAQGMYGFDAFPSDHRFWHFLAYCAGTGGSIFIIGSAAGIAVMGMERISFGWFVRHFSLLALAGYAAGAATFVALHGLPG